MKIVARKHFVKDPESLQMAVMICHRWMSPSQLDGVSRQSDAMLINRSGRRRSFWFQRHWGIRFRSRTHSIQRSDSYSVNCGRSKIFYRHLNATYRSKIGHRVGNTPLNNLAVSVRLQTSYYYFILFTHN